MNAGLKSVISWMPDGMIAGDIMKIAIVNCFDTYEHRVLLLQDYFRRCSFDVAVVTSDYRHFQKKYRSKTPDGFVLVHAAAYRRNLSAERMVSHIKFAKAAFRTVEAYAPDLLWVLAPPNSLIKEAVEYRKIHPETKLIIDLIDMWPETMPISRLKKLPPFLYWRNLREHYVQNADAVVTECNLYQTIMDRRKGVGNFHTLYLAKELPEADGEVVRTEICPPADRWVLCYLGSINHIIAILCICEILRALPKREKKPVVHVIGDGEQREQFLQAVKDAGADAVYHGKIFDQLPKQEILNGCHFGLNVMKDSVFVGLTMKSLDYFAGGLPVLNTIKGDTWALVETEGIGINCQYDTHGQIVFMPENGFAIGPRVYRDKVRKMFGKYFTVQAFERKVSEILDSVMGCVKD